MGISAIIRTLRHEPLVKVCVEVTFTKKNKKNPNLKNNCLGSMLSRNEFVKYEPYIKMPKVKEV